MQASMRIMDRGFRACGEGTPPIYSSSIQEVGLYARTLDINLTADQCIGHAYAKIQFWKYADAWAALEETQQGVVETSYNQDPSVISQPRDRNSGVSRRPLTRATRAFPLSTVHETLETSTTPTILARVARRNRVYSTVPYVSHRAGVARNCGDYPSPSFLAQRYSPPKCPNRAGAAFRLLQPGATHPSATAQND